ncbi:hypothetical protein BD780_002821 [Clostridium tetanomorphum]|nr:hypothetical protein [Clostridium tetanomorphum]NRS85596.1 hypothetical protein [Clostridium tetanomorphum]NRZ96393.1 hypothetical protein [Clostridium tetanomorphum]SQC02679.1 Uncharacterised protein [Clostridium tetanomorphum]
MHREDKKKSKRGNKKSSNPDIIHVDEMKKHNNKNKNL